MKINKYIYLVVFLVFNYVITKPLIASSKNENNALLTNRITKIDKYDIDFSKVESQITTPGGIGSSLVFKEQKDNKLYFHMLTDRGPNFEGPDTIKDEETIVFGSPEFKPYIGLVEVSPKDKTAHVISTTTLFDQNNREINGMFKSKSIYNNKVFVPLDRNLDVINQVNLGIDSESLAVDHDGSYWIGEEYVASLLHFTQDGKLIKRYLPGKELPAILSKISLNRGIEAMTITKSGKIVFVIESILSIGQDKEKTNFVRVVSFDPETEKSKMYIYKFDAQFYKAPSVKIGDIEAIDEDRFILIEQGREKTGNINNNLFMINLAGATDISTLDPKIANNLEFEPHTESSKIIPVQKKLLLELRKNGWTFEKAEGLAIIAPNKIAIANDNDFAMQGNLLSSNNEPLVMADYRLNILNKKVYNKDNLELENTKFITTSTKEQNQLWIIEFKENLF